MPLLPSLEMAWNVMTRQLCLGSNHFWTKLGLLPRLERKTSAGIFKKLRPCIQTCVIDQWKNELKTSRKKKLFMNILNIWVFSPFLKDNQNIFRERPGYAGSLPSVRVTRTYANVTHNADSDIFSICTNLFYPTQSSTKPCSSKKRLTNDTTHKNPKNNKIANLP